MSCCAHTPLFLCLLLSACGEEAAPPADAGPDLTVAKEAALPSPERTVTDRPPADAAGALPCAAGLDLAPLQLDPAYCVTARQALPQLPSGLALQQGRVLTFRASGTPALLLEVKEHSLDAKGQLGAATSFLSASVPVGSAKLFGGEYLALAPSGGAAAVGYNESGTTEGAIFWGERGATPRKLEQAKGNYDALFLDEKTLLVNGTGLGAAQEGQGLYLAREGQAPRRLVKELGTFSGQIGLTGSVLLVGGYFPTGNKIYAFTLEEVSAAIAAGVQLAPAADGDLVYSGESLDATALEESLVVVRMDASFKVLGVSRLGLSVSGKTVTAAAPSTVVTVPAGAVSVDRVASWQGALALLLSGGQSPEVALIRRRP